MDEQKQKRSKAAYFTLVGLSTAILLATPVLILLGVGFLLDTLFKTGPIFLLAGGIIGFISGMFNIYKLLTKMKQ